MSWLIPFLAMASVVLTLHLGLGLLLRCTASRDAVARYRLCVGTTLSAPLVLVAPFLFVPEAAPPPIAPATTTMVRPEITSSPGPVVTMATAYAERAASGVKRLTAPAESQGWLLPTYWLGMCGLLAAYVLRLAATWRLIRSSAPVKDAVSLQTLKDAAVATATHRPVRLVTSSQVTGTACFDLITPTILLPTGAGLRHADLHCALLHELIHIRRRDGLIATLQVVIQCAFWFHPLVWVFGRILHQDRETSCDATVVRTTGKPRTYARALLNCFETRHAISPGPLALHGINRNQSTRFITRRLKMLSHATTQNSARMLIATCCLGIGVVAVVVAAQTQVVAQLNGGAGVQGNAVAEIHAPEGDRSAAAVGRKYRRVAEMPEFAHLKRFFDPDYEADSPLRDQESLVSAEKGRVVGTNLLTRDAHVNLPEGSKLYARLNGDHVQMQPTESTTELAIQNGSIAVFDEQHVQRLQVRSPESGRLLATMSLANSEVSFQVSAVDANGDPADVSIAMETQEGIPPGEEDPPHGAVRYALNSAERGSYGTVVLKMQWIYDIKKLREASM